MDAIQFVTARTALNPRYRPFDRKSTGYRGKRMEDGIVAADEKEIECGKGEK